jgi:hypothetical protein
MSTGTISKKEIPTPEKRHKEKRERRRRKTKHRHFSSFLCVLVW